MDYTLIRTSRRTLAIQIDRDGSLIVRSPLRTSLTLIEDFIREKSSWIEKHQLQKKQILEKMQDDASYYWLFGERYPLGSEERSMIEARSKKALELYIEGRVAYYQKAHSIEKPIQKIRISSARTRWGSCSSKGALSFSSRLSEYPKGAIDAVIIHELAHLYHMNHGERFWSLVYHWMPGYKEEIGLLGERGGRF